MAEDKTMNDKTPEEMVADQETLTDAQLYDLILDWYNRAVRYREGRSLSKSWERYEKIYDNGAWDLAPSSRDADLSTISSNLLFEAVETMIPVITARPPRPEITAIPDPDKVDDEDYINQLNRYATQVQRECVNIWSRSNMMPLLQKAFREHEIKGTHITRTVYDLKRHRHVTEILDLLSCLPNPEASTMQECYDSWFIYAPIMSVERVKKVYKIDVEGEGEYDELRKYNYKTNKGIRGMIQSIQNRLGGEDFKSKGYVTVIECHMADLENQMEEYELEEFDDDGKAVMEDVKDDNGAVVYDEDGKTPKQRQKSEKKTRVKYPNGYVATIIRSKKGDIIRKRKNPYKRSSGGEDSGTLEFLRTANYERALDFYGISEGKNIEDQIMMKNVLLSNVNDNSRYTGNPVLVTDENTEVDMGDARPGGHVVTSDVQGVKFLQPPNMATDVWRLIEYTDADADRKVGMNDAIRGIAKSGDSGVKTQALIAQATGRLQPKTAAMVDFVRDLYEHWVYIMQKYYPDKITQQVKGTDGKTRFEVFEPKKFGDVKLQVELSIISMLPFDNYAEFEEASALFEMINPDTQKPIMSVDQLIDSAPALRDKQRAKEYNREEEEKIDFARQLEAVMSIEDPARKTEALQALLEDHPERAEEIAKSLGIELPPVVDKQV